MLDIMSRLAYTEVWPQVTVTHETCSYTVKSTSYFTSGNLEKNILQIYKTHADLIVKLPWSHGYRAFPLFQGGIFWRRKRGSKLPSQLSPTGWTVCYHDNLITYEGTLLQMRTTISPSYLIGTVPDVHVSLKRCVSEDCPTISRAFRGKLLQLLPRYSASFQSLLPLVNLTNNSVVAGRKELFKVPLPPHGSIHNVHQ